MKKNEKTVLWVIGIAVVLLVLAQFFSGNVPFAIAGGGAGSSISQTVYGVEMPVYEWGEYWKDEGICVIRPPVGETWLITGYTVPGGSVDYECHLMVTDYIDLDADEIPSTDRIFIDHDAYLACYSWNGMSLYGCSAVTIIGVRI